MRGKLPAQKSLKAMEKEEMKKGGMPNDIGLLQGRASSLGKNDSSAPILEDTMV